MQIVFEVEVPDDLDPAVIGKLQRHVHRQAVSAVTEFIQNELTPGGCWCRLEHREDCPNWVLPY